MTKRKIIERLRDDLAALHAVGAIRKVVMRKFDAVVPPAVRQFIPKSTKRLVKPIKFS